MELHTELTSPPQTDTPDHRQGSPHAPSDLPVTHSALLFLSTAVAALFCYLYLTKPTVISMENPNIPLTTPTATRSAEPTQPITEAIAAPVAPPATLKPAPVAKAPMHGAWEETNLHVQHVLTAEATGGRTDRIELNVPILYQCRTLRWTDEEVVAARHIHEQLVRHQEQSRLLREQGRQLLASWNELITRSIPNEALRADSPSLPDNQRDAMDSPRPAGWTSTELIEIKSSEP
jgi:hypothetical protein